MKPHSGFATIQTRGRFKMKIGDIYTKEVVFGGEHSFWSPGRNAVEHFGKKGYGKRVARIISIQKFVGYTERIIYESYMIDPWGRCKIKPGLNMSTRSANMFIYGKLDNDFVIPAYCSGDCNECEDDCVYGEEWIDNL